MNYKEKVISELTHVPTIDELKTIEQELNKYAKRFIKKHYNLDLTINIDINARLKKAYGYYKCIIDNKTKKLIRPINISINKNYLIACLHDGTEGMEAILDTLYHECIHYSLSVLGKNFRDGEDDFENEILKKKISSNYNKEFANRYDLVDIYEINNIEYKYYHTKNNMYNGIKRKRVEVIKYDILDK